LGRLARTLELILPLSHAAWYDARKEVVMIELSEDQVRAIEREPPPPLAVDPRTGQKYRLISEEMYQRIQAVLRPINRAWADPELDVYEQYRRKS
jgi:hypothetical protein